MQVFETLSKVDCAEHIEKKGGLSYLSWSWAVDLLLKRFPTASWSFEEADDGSHFFPYQDGTGEVRVNVTVENVTRGISLPVMDHRNKAITSPDACAINKAKMRCLAKGIALHGLGLYIFSGEDLPSDPDLSGLKEQLNGNLEDVLEYLRHNGGLQEGETIDDLPSVWKKRAMTNPSGLIKAAQEFKQNQEEVPV